LVFGYFGFLDLDLDLDFKIQNKIQNPKFFGFGFGFQNPKQNPKSKIFWIPVSGHLELKLGSLMCI